MVIRVIQRFAYDDPTLAQSGVCEKIARSDNEWDGGWPESVFPALERQGWHPRSKYFRRECVTLRIIKYLYSFRKALKISFPLAKNMTLSELLRNDKALQEKAIVCIMKSIIGRKESPAYQKLNELKPYVSGLSRQELIQKVVGVSDQSMEITYEVLAEPFSKAIRGEFRGAMQALLSLAEKHQIPVPLEQKIAWIQQEVGKQDLFYVAKEVLRSTSDEKEFYALAKEALKEATQEKAKSGPLGSLLSFMDLEERAVFKQEDIQEAYNLLFSKESVTPMDLEAKAQCFQKLKEYMQEQSSSDLHLGFAQWSLDYIAAANGVQVKEYMDKHPYQQEDYFGLLRNYVMNGIDPKIREENGALIQSFLDREEKLQLIKNRCLSLIEGYALHKNICATVQGADIKRAVEQLLQRKMKGTYYDLSRDFRLCSELLQDYGIEQPSLEDVERSLKFVREQIKFAQKNINILYENSIKGSEAASADLRTWYTRKSEFAHSEIKLVQDKVRFAQEKIKELHANPIKISEMAYADLQKRYDININLEFPDPTTALIINGAILRLSRLPKEVTPIEQERTIKEVIGPLIRDKANATDMHSAIVSLCSQGIDVDRIRLFINNEVGKFFTDPPLLQVIIKKLLEIETSSLHLKHREFYLRLLKEYVRGGYPQTFKGEDIQQIIQELLTLYDRQIEVEMNNQEKDYCRYFLEQYARQHKIDLYRNNLQNQGSSTGIAMDWEPTPSNNLSLSATPAYSASSASVLPQTAPLSLSSSSWTRKPPTNQRTVVMGQSSAGPRGRLAVSSLPASVGPQGPSPNGF